MHTRKLGTSAIPAVSTSGPPDLSPRRLKRISSSKCAGLPGIGFRQDPIEYNSITHHTNLDTYERIIPEDVKEALAEVAAAVWFVANRDQMTPRFTKETMPAPVAAR